MAREIRVTIDDDEVFERMRARKRELDLSWEEVLHRGLREENVGDLGDRIEQQIRERVSKSLERSFGLDPDDSGASSATSGQPASHGDPSGAPGPMPDVPMTPDFPSGVDPTGGDPSGGPGAGGSGASGGLNATVETLSNAEDAVLRFPFLSDEPGNRVPLRVQLETTAEGLDVTVVAIRTGKSVAEYNAFDRGARPRIAAALAEGEPAVLSLGDGAETYEVVPALSWQATDDGPTVTEVSVREVRVGE